MVSDASTPFRRSRSLLVVIAINTEVPCVDMFTGPYDWHRRRGSRAGGDGILERHTVFGESIKCWCKVELRIKESTVVDPKTIDRH
jgi:hypothetical protein